jgi:redox-sensitive bicupin YhaK (pirin superfamily)
MSAPQESTHAMTATATVAASPIVQIKALGFPWETIDPFLFCAYHDDAYPRANGQMGPDAPLAGRDLGQDFSRKDGWSMYHGNPVPGFPGHPHRGFETVTIVRKGLIDHSDSLGATARFGGGDVQWLTAGKGIVHSEMFPLLDASAPNPLELFQIWLNLPARSKMAEPHFTMFWAEDIPRFTALDAEGRSTEVASIAGRIAPIEGEPGAGGPLAPPPDSWAAQPDADLAIWTVKMEPQACWVLPAATGKGTRRTLYFFKGRSVRVAGQQVDHHAAIELRADARVELINGDEESEFLVLQGRPIGEPVAQYGPFVMNTQAEIAQAMADYRSTQFGGWPWGDIAPVHGRSPTRFARHPDGREERPEQAAAGAAARG